MEPLGCNHQNLQCGLLHRVNCQEDNRHGVIDLQIIRDLVDVNQLQWMDITLVLIQMNRLLVLQKKTGIFEY